MSSQRSFDASTLFGRRRERGEPRRAASEDQRKCDRGSAAELDNEKTIDERSKYSILFLPMRPSFVARKVGEKTSECCKATVVRWLGRQNGTAL